MYVLKCDARPTATFPAVAHHCLMTCTKLYCLGQRHMCVNNLPIRLKQHYQYAVIVHLCKC